MPPVPAILGGRSLDPNIGIVVTMNTAGVNAGFQNLNNQVNQLAQTVQQRATPAFNALDSIGKILAAGTLVDLGKKFLEIAANMERMQTAMSILEGSMAAASETMDQLLTIAAKAPFSLQGITDAFLKIKTGGFDQPVQMVQTLVDAVAAFGGSEQKFKNAAFAIQEIGGKGVVQMKELRRQLGDAIPSAIAAMAEGLGISITRLTIDVQKGAITAQDGIAAMFKSFAEHYKGSAELFSKTFLGSIRQLETEFSRMAINFNKAGGLNVLTAAIILITDKVKELDTYLSSSAGQAAFSNFIMNLASHAPDLNTVVTTIEHLVQVLGSISNVVLSALGPDLAGAGLLGYIFFGKKGFIAAIVIEQFGGVISAIATLIASLLDGIRSVVGDTAMEAGIIGFLLFGKMGIKAALGAVVGAVTTMGATISAVFSGILLAAVATIAGVVVAQKNAISANDRIRNGGTPSYYTTEGIPVFTPDNKTGLGEQIKGEGDAASDATPKVKTFADTLKDMVKTVQDAQNALRTQTQPLHAFDLTAEQAKNVEKFADALQQVQIRIDQLNAGGDTATKFVEEFNAKPMKGMLDTLHQLQRAYAEAVGSGNVGRETAIAIELKEIQNQIDGARSKLGEFKSLSDQTLAKSLTDRLNNLNAQIDAHAPPSEKFDPSVAVAKAAEPFAQFQKQIDEISQKYKGLSTGTAEQTALTDGLAASQTKLNDVMQKATEYAKRHAEEQKRDLDLRTQGEALSLNERADALLGASDYDKIATAVAHASLEYKNLLNAIQKLKTANPDNAELNAQLDALDLKLEKSQDKILLRAKQDADGTSALWKSVGTSMEDAFAEGFDSLIHHTKSAKDVLLDFYANITKAVEQYLAKQAMIGLIGGDGSIGGAASSGGISGGLIGKAGGWLAGLMSSGGATSAAFDAAAPQLATAFAAGGFAKGGVFRDGITTYGSVKKFATGGLLGGPTMFGLGGEAGPEGILPLEKVGGKLGVNASGMQGGDNYTIQIQAVDAPSVQALFYKEADGMISALQSRQRLRKFGRR